MFTRDSKILSNRLTTPITSVANAVGDVFKPTYNQLIKSIFANNEQGFAYDPNDLTTMFQDASGTVPVTGAGQPVGLVLDKSKGLLLGVEKKGTATTQLTGSANAATYNPSTGEATCTRVDFSNQSFIRISGLTGTHHKVAITNTGTTSVSVRTGLNSGDQIILNVNAGQSATLFIVPSNGAVTLTSGAGTASFTINYIKELAGNHAYQTTSASRPILRQNATTGAYYLEFDGSDDFLQTASIDFTATDKVSLFAGVRKLSDASLGMMVELSSDATTNNGFYIATPSNAGVPAYRLAIGSPNAQVVSTSTFPAPVSNVIAASYDKSKSTVLASTKLRVNGTQNALAASVDGDSLGTFSNSPIYIGRRGGTTLPFNGHIYSLIGIGRLTTDSETTALEKELAKRTGVTLNV